MSAQNNYLLAESILAKNIKKILKTKYNVYVTLYLVKGKEDVLKISFGDYKVNLNWIKHKDLPFKIEGKIVTNGKDCIRLGKFIRNIFGEDNPQEIEKIIEKLVVPYGLINKYIENIIETYNVSKIYDMEHYSEHTIGCSCMRGHGDYYDNLKRVFPLRVAYLLDEDGILIGRALLWDNVHDENGNNIGTVLDRIYSANNDIEIAFKSYAERKGYWRKKRQTYTDAEIVKNGDVYHGVHYVKTNDYIEDDCPFLDTYRYIFEDRLCTHDYCDGEGALMVADDTHGYPTRLHTCDCCGEYSRDLIYVGDYDADYNNVCEYCHSDLYVFSEYYDTYIRREDTIQVYILGYGFSYIYDRGNYDLIELDIYSEDIFEDYILSEIKSLDCPIMARRDEVIYCEDIDGYAYINDDGVSHCQKHDIYFWDYCPNCDKEEGGENNE